MSETKPLVRCAIYTRKSTEDGLEQDFNTLQAQREAAEAYILSQKQAGWHALPCRYDDGGFSGATLERPALAQLLAAIEGAEIDCVVVYKVDRLSRSLLDFARLLSLLERHNVSFVSVTQEFNTTTSLGRLTLNILLSFAQFEREIISERTRDKMAAARRKGKWMGGSPVLGYDIDSQRRGLVVNPSEAEQVRHIFALCAQSETRADALREIDRLGMRTKQWTSKTGQQHPGTYFQHSTLALLLRNPLYKGQILHQGVLYPGEQPALLEPALWEQVNRKHAPGARHGRPHAKVQTALVGLLQCAACGFEMGGRYTVKAGVRYLYYLCRSCQKTMRPKPKPVASANLESSLFRELEPLLGAPLTSAQLQQTVERLSYHPVTGQLSITLRNGTRFAYRVPAAQGRTSRKPRPPELQRVPALSRMLALAITCQKLIEEGTVASFEELAPLTRLSRSRLSQILLLANLAPAIQEQLLFLSKLGSAPDRLFLKDIRHLLPVLDWRQQTALFQSVWSQTARQR